MLTAITPGASPHPHTLHETLPTFSISPVCSLENLLYGLAGVEAMQGGEYILVYDNEY